MSGTLARARAAALALVLTVAAVGCGGPRPVEAVDASTLLTTTGAGPEAVELEPAGGEVVADLREGLEAQVDDDRLHDVVVRRIVEGDRGVGIAVAATFTVALDEGIVDGFVRGALDGRDPAERTRRRLEDGTPLTVFRSGSGFGGAVWVRGGGVALVLTPAADRAGPLARTLAVGGSDPPSGDAGPGTAGVSR